MDVYSALGCGIRGATAVFAAVLLHEAGHLIACRILRVPLRQFRLKIGGAVLGYDASSVSYGKEAIVAAAGPLAGLGGTALAAWTDSPRTAFFGLVCLSLSVFNLLPIPPLDGGVLLSCALFGCLDADNAARVLSAVRHGGVILLWICAVLLQLRCGGNLSLLVISVFLLVRLSE